MAIDVGPPCNISDSTAGIGYTVINKENPANASGTIDAFCVKASGNATFDIASFVDEGSNVLTTNGVAQGISVISGENNFSAPGDFTAFNINLGEYLGGYITGASWWQNSDGYAGIWYKESDEIPASSVSFYWASGYGYALYATGTEAAGAEHTKSLSDTINMTDSRIVSFGLNKADTISLSDSLSKAFGLNEADSITLSDSIIKAPGLNKADTINMTDVVSSKTFGLNKADTINMTDSIIKAFGLSLSDTITLSDLIVKGFGLSKADTINLSDSISKEFGLSLSDTITMTDLSDLGAVVALYNFIAKNRTFNFNAKNTTFNFNAKPKTFNFNARVGG